MSALINTVATIFTIIGAISTILTIGFVGALIHWSIKTDRHNAIHKKQASLLRTPTALTIHANCKCVGYGEIVTPGYMSNAEIEAERIIMNCFNPKG